MKLKYFLIGIIAILICFAGVTAYTGRVPQAITTFGTVFLFARVCFYITALFIVFDNVTSLLLNRFIRDASYADVIIRPNRVRILVWAVLIELLMFNGG